MSATRIVLLSQDLDLGFLANAFRDVDPTIEVFDRFDAPGAEEANVAVCWQPPAGALARLPKLQLIQSIAAGVDHILPLPDLPAGIPVCRVIDPGMAAGMSAYVVWAITHRQRHFDRYLASAAERDWRPQPIRSPRSHRVGIAGMGWLGRACAHALLAIGYSVRGWTRTGARPAPPGVAAFHGREQLDAFLAGCDALVCLLPLTTETRGFLGAACFDRLPRGAALVHVGRGAHLVEADLLSALDSGQLDSATLDAFSDEPLPGSHPFWTHPRIIVTPHIASRTERHEIVRQTLAHIAAIRLGQRPDALVDPARGY